MFARVSVIASVCPPKDTLAIGMPPLPPASSSARKALACATVGDALSVIVSVPVSRPDAIVNVAMLAKVSVIAVTTMGLAAPLRPDTVATDPATPTVCPPRCSVAPRLPS